MVPSELADGEKNQRRGEYHEERRQKIVAARILLREALERGVELAEAVPGERAVREPRQLRHGGGPERRFRPERAQQAAPAQLLVHPALEVGLGGVPQVEVGVELASQAFDVEQRLLQQHELGLDLDVEAPRGLEQAQQQPAEVDFLQRPREYRLADRADRRLELVDTRVRRHPVGLEARMRCITITRSEQSSQCTSGTSSSAERSKLRRSWLAFAASRMRLSSSSRWRANSATTSRGLSRRPSGQRRSTNSAAVARSATSLAISSSTRGRSTLTATSRPSCNV